METDTRPIEESTAKVISETNLPIFIKQTETDSLKTQVRKINTYNSCFPLYKHISAFVKDDKLWLDDGLLKVAFEDCVNNEIKLIYDADLKYYMIDPTQDKTQVVLRKRRVDNTSKFTHPDQSDDIKIGWEYYAFLTDTPATSDPPSMFVLSQLMLENFPPGEIVEGATNKYDYIYNNTLPASEDEVKDILQHLSEKDYTNLDIAQKRTSDAIVKFDKRISLLRERSVREAIKEQVKKAAAKAKMSEKDVIDGIKAKKYVLGVDPAATDKNDNIVIFNTDSGKLMTGESNGVEESTGIDQTSSGGD